MRTSQVLHHRINGRHGAGANGRLSFLRQSLGPARQANQFATAAPMATKRLRSGGDSACGASSIPVAPGPLQLPEAVAEYVRQQPFLRDLLGIPASSNANNCTDSDSFSSNSGSRGSDDIRGRGGEVTVAEVSGGRINFVWLVSGPKGDVVLKYAAPFVRSIGPEFQLSQARLGVEAEAMAAAHAACPQHVPALLLYDAAANVLVQELVSGPQGRRRVKLVDALARRELSGAGGDAGSVGTAALAAAVDAALPPPPPQRLAADLAALLAGYLLRNSVYELPYGQHAAAAERLRNGEVVAANAAVVFTDPWDGGCDRNRVPQGLAGRVTQLRADASVQQEVSRLLGLYLSSCETLIHNDLTAGNILVTDPVPEPPPSLPPGSGAADGKGGGSGPSSETHLIDWEFATYGPMSYDIGSLLGNLLLSYCATCCCTARQPAAGVAVAPSPPLLRCIVELWEELEARILSYTSIRHMEDAGDGGAGGGATRAATAHSGAFVQQVLSDSLGYAGCVMARLLFGMHHYPALEAITCDRQRTTCQRLALQLAAALLRPEERVARGWDRTAAGTTDDGGGGLGGSGIRQLVRDVEAWAVEAEAGT